MDHRAHRADINFISGIIAGVSNVIICSPLDTARTRMQVQGLYNFKSRGVIETISDIRSKEGFRGLYRGLGASLLAYPCSWSFYFVFYEELKDYLKQIIQHDFFTNMLSASLAGLISTFISNPLWLIRTRLQANSQPNATALKIANEIIKQDGFRALYKGFTASIFGVSHVAIYFPLYELAKSYMNISDNPTFFGILVSTCIPKICASVVSYPHEVIRSRIFIHNSKIDNRFNGVLSLVWYTYSTEGMKGFYGGFKANLIRIIPSTFVTLYTYEKVKHYLISND